MMDLGVYDVRRCVLDCCPFLWLEMVVHGRDVVGLDLLVFDCWMELLRDEVAAFLPLLSPTVVVADLELSLLSNDLRRFLGP